MKNQPQLTPTRRRFIQNFGLGLTGSLLFTSATSKDPIPHLPLKPLDQPDERYWEMVKQQFAIPKDKLMMNAANLCASPFFIHDKVNQLSQDLATDVSFQNRSKYQSYRKEAIELIAQYLGVSNSEIGITRNTSEANNIVVNGLDFKAGDEVVIWDQNHPTNNIAWKHKAKRMGFTVKEFHVPTQPSSKAELIEAVMGAVGPNTRLLCFSHISNTSGIALPAPKICALAKEKGIMTLVDGAQSLGFLDLDLKAIGCTFYSSSTHKWLMGPMENGVLYVDESYQDRLWPNIIAAGWDEEYESLDDKVCVLGQRNTPSTAALPDIIRFHNQIGKDQIEKRIRQLASYFKNKVQEEIPGATFVTPLEEDLSGGVVILNITGKEPRELFQQLYEQYGIACAPTGGLRVSPTVNCVKEDVDTLVTALVELST